MRHATVSAQPNLRSQFKTSTQPLNFSLMGPWGRGPHSCSFPPSQPFFSFLSGVSFFLPWNDFAELYRRSDWFLCLHRPLQRAPDNELLLLKWRVWEGRFQLRLNCREPWMRNDPLVHIHWKLCHWRRSLWPRIRSGKNLELVLQIHFLMKKKAKSTAGFRILNSFSRQWDKKGRIFGEEPPFFFSFLH